MKQKLLEYNRAVISSRFILLCAGALTHQALGWGYVLFLGVLVAINAAVIKSAQYNSHE